MKKDDNKWYLFLISLGFLLVATSPMVVNTTFNVVSGLALVGLGFFSMRKK